MLIPGYKPGETVYLVISNLGRISITIADKDIGIETPKEVLILRDELLKDTISWMSSFT